MTPLSPESFDMDHGIRGQFLLIRRSKSKLYPSLEYLFRLFTKHHRNCFVTLLAATLRLPSLHPFMDPLDLVGVFQLDELIKVDTKVNPPNKAKNLQDGESEKYVSKVKIILFVLRHHKVADSPFTDVLGPMVTDVLVIYDTQHLIN